MTIIPNSPHPALDRAITDLRTACERLVTLIAAAGGSARIQPCPVREPHDGPHGYTGPAGDSLWCRGNRGQL